MGLVCTAVRGVVAHSVGKKEETRARAAEVERRIGESMSVLVVVSLSRLGSWPAIFLFYFILVGYKMKKTLKSSFLFEDVCFFCRGFRFSRRSIGLYC